jgi:adenylate cyclase
MLNVIRAYLVRRRIQSMFGTCLSPDAVSRLVKSGKTPVVGPAEVELTPFFASVHDFVGFAEQVRPEQLLDWTNAYFETCTDGILGEGGTIDKYVGDALIAMFGAPVPQENHAAAACVAALRCHARVAELRERWTREGNQRPTILRQFRIRVGLHTGPALVGNMGTSQRFNYTMMGDNVNLAARMESAAKSWGVWTLCTEATKRACEQHAPGQVLFRSLGRTAVKGRVDPLGIFEVVSLRSETPDQLVECVELFETGLARYRESDWHGAFAWFEKSAALEPHQPGSVPNVTSNPSLVFKRLAQTFRDDPGQTPRIL